MRIDNCITIIMRKLIVFVCAMCVMMLSGCFGSKASLSSGRGGEALQPELESGRALKQIRRGERGPVLRTHKAPPLGCRERLSFWAP